MSEVLDVDECAELFVINGQVTDRFSRTSANFESGNSHRRRYRLTWLLVGIPPSYGDTIDA